MQSNSIYHHDNLYFGFSFTNHDGSLALTVRVWDECGSPLVEQHYPMNKGTAGASWLLYWHLLKAAHKEEELPKTISDALYF